MADADSDTLARRVLDIVRGDPDPECPEGIRPLSWLASLIQDSRERGPRAGEEDPQAWREMLDEVADFHRKLKEALSNG